jgi:Lrp/AsnC family transcriptional regulator for asnA, asnC and gidA
MNNINKLDVQIITLLEQDARQSSNTIAKKLGVSSATIRRRINKLLKSDVLRIVGKRNPEKAGLPVAVLMGLNMDHRLVDSVMGKIRNLPEVEWACTTTGRFDAFVFARFRSNEDFSIFLRDNITIIEGLKDSETFMCLHVEKEGQIC